MFRAQHMKIMVQIFDINVKKRIFGISQFHVLLFFPRFFLLEGSALKINGWDCCGHFANFPRIAITLFIIHMRHLFRNTQDMDVFKKRKVGNLNMGRVSLNKNNHLHSNFSLNYYRSGAINECPNSLWIQFGI